MTAKNLNALAAACCTLATVAAQAAPTLTVSGLGVSGGNRQWAVDITPDASLFYDPADNPDRGLGGSMSVELAFAVDHTDLLGVDVNTTAWDFANPGFNPFTNTITDGLWLDLIGDRTFGAFGSIFFTSGDPVRLFTIHTAGGGLAAIRYGTAASGDPVRGSTISQAGLIFEGGQGTVTLIPFSGLTGALSVPEPASVATGCLGVCLLSCFANVRKRSA